jgi:tetrahydromethanopterin S-methyltransferase subunit C
MAINFSDKVLVTNPTTYSLGRGVLSAGLIAISVGAITHFTGDFILPPMAWCALGLPTAVVGGIFMRCGMTRN